MLKYRRTGSVCDREYDQQHDTFSGHIRNGEQLVQIGTAENEGNNRADQDRPAHPVERLADPVENHKTDNGEQYGGSGRNIFRADRKFLAEDDECCDHKKSVSAAGQGRVRMFVIKWPAIRFLFGISESRKPGIPIVNILISEIWDGSSGYVTIEISEKMDSRNEKMFFTRNSVPERAGC